MSVLTELAEFLTSRNYDNIPQDVIQIVRGHMLDSIGCAVSSSEEPSIKILERFLRSQPDGEGDHTVIGSDRGTSLLSAAFINGSKADAQEMADINMAAGGHGGATIVPAALAVAEETRCTGKELLAALACGYEAMRVTVPAYPQSLGKACHTAIINGTFGAAAATGKMYNFDNEDMINALGNCAIAPIAPSEPCNEGGYVKDLYTGAAARTGIFCALLAKEKFVGTPSLLDGKMGLFTELQVVKPASGVTDGLGDKWIVRDTIIKPHACCRFTHSSADLLLDLNLDPDQVESIDVTVATLSYNLCKGSSSKLEDSVAARFSIPYVVGCAMLFKRTLIPSDFTMEAIKNPKVYEISQKVHVHHNPDMDVDWPVPPAGKGHRSSVMDIIMKDGRKIHQRVDNPKGSAENPCTWQEILNKFCLLTNGYYTPERQQQIIHAVEDLEKIGDCRGFVRLLRRDNYIGI